MNSENIQRNLIQRICKQKLKARTVLSLVQILALAMLLLRVLHHGAHFGSMCSCFIFYDLLLFLKFEKLLEWFGDNINNV